jgi:hypothetical protein
MLRHLGLQSEKFLVIAALPPLYTTIYSQAACCIKLDMMINCELVTRNPPARMAKPDGELATKIKGLVKESTGISEQVGTIRRNFALSIIRNEFNNRQRVANHYQIRGCRALINFLRAEMRAAGDSLRPQGFLLVLFFSPKEKSLPGVFINRWTTRNRLPQSVIPRLLIFQQTRNRDSHTIRPGHSRFLIRQKPDSK